MKTCHTKITLGFVVIIAVTAGGFAARTFSQPIPAPTSQATAKAVDPHRFDAEIAAFAKLDAANPPPTDPTVFVGSSSFRKWKTLEETFKDLKAINRGFGGAQLTDVLFFLDQTVLRYKPATVIIYCGGNDLADDRAPQTVAQTAEAVCEKIHATLPDTRIFYLSNIVAPSRAKWMNAFDQTNDLIAAYSVGHPYLHFIEARHLWSDARGQPDPSFFISDHLHPSADGYRKLVPVIRAAVES